MLGRPSVDLDTHFGVGQTPHVVIVLTVQTSFPEQLGEQVDEQSVLQSVVLYEVKKKGDVSLKSFKRINLLYFTLCIAKPD